MTFLNPAILWGLTAIAVPVIVHFFNLQRPKLILFSNVAFVKEVKKTVVKKVKFQQWLLLLLRILAISALVMAFANPIWVGDNQNLLSGNRSVAFIIDNSLSMRAGNDKGEYLKQAVSLVQSTLESYNDQDEFLVMPTSDLQFNASFIDKSDALEALKTIDIDQNTRSHQEILSFLDDIYQRCSYQNRELYFLSDFQLSTVLSDSQYVAGIDSSYIVNYIPLADRDQRNVYISGHQITSRVVEPEKPVTMTMRLVNDGNSQISDLNVRVVLEEKVVAIDNQDIGPEVAKDLSLTFTPTKSSWLSGYIEINDNPITFDNKRYFSLYVPQREKILVVEGQSSVNIRVLFESVFNQFDANFVSIRNISQETLSDYRSVILLGIADISTGLSDKLSTFLEEGGSVMFFPGDNTDPANINPFFERIQVGEWSEPISYQDGITANEVDLDHPLFEGIFSDNRANREFDAPQIYQVHPLSLDNQTVHNRILSINGETPIVTESKIGEGLLFNFTLFPGDNWTDLHVKTIFAPLIFRATQIMNQTQQVQSSITIGTAQPKLVRTSVKDLIYLTNESGEEFIPEQYNQSGGLILNFDKLSLESGNYRLTQNEVLLEKIAFNISDQESKLDFSTTEELDDRLLNANLSEINLLPARIETISQTLKISRQGVPLWKYCILLAILFLLTEIVLLKVFKRS